MHKRYLLLLFLILFLVFPVAGNSESIEAFGIQFSSDTSSIDFDALGLDVVDTDTLCMLIDQCPSLQEVLMFNSSISQPDMEFLFDKYPNIFFGFTLRLATHVIRTDVTAFSTLHWSSPKDGDPRHTSEELFILRLCKKLKALDLGHNYLTDLNFLNYLPDIEVLIISPNYGLTDISPVANCKNLVYLECFNTPITDISALAGLTKLRDLNLTRCYEITDISPLYDLPIERFWWGYLNKVPNEQKKIMRQTHPKCKFGYVYDPTSGGWRSHPHQRQQHDFFRTGVYIPFSD